MSIKMVSAIIAAVSVGTLLRIVLSVQTPLMETASNTLRPTSPAAAVLAANAVSEPVTWFAESEEGSRLRSYVLGFGRGHADMKALANLRVELVKQPGAHFQQIERALATLPATMDVERQVLVQLIYECPVALPEKLRVLKDEFLRIRGTPDKESLRLSSLVAFETYISMTKDTDKVRRLVMRALADMGPAHEAVPLLLERYGAQDPGNADRLARKMSDPTLKGFTDIEEAVVLFDDLDSDPRMHTLLKKLQENE